MENKEIVVTIVGKSNSGKSSIGSLLNYHLSNNNVESKNNTGFFSELTARRNLAFLSLKLGSKPIRVIVTNNLSKYDNEENEGIIFFVFEDLHEICLMERHFGKFCSDYSDLLKVEYDINFPKIENFNHHPSLEITINKLTVNSPVKKNPNTYLNELSYFKILRIEKGSLITFYPHISRFHKEAPEQNITGRTIIPFNEEGIEKIDQTINPNAKDILTPVLRTVNEFGFTGLDIIVLVSGDKVDLCLTVSKMATVSPAIFEKELMRYI